MKAKLHLKIIALFSYLIPRRFRSDWAEEWNAELQYRESKPGRDLLRPSLGAFWDALAMQSRRLEEEFWQDVRFGVRTFASSRGVTAAVILSLALGIGLNTAIFSVTDPLLLKKLPVRNPDELVLFQWTMKTDGPSYAVGTSGESRHYDAETGISTGGVFSFLAFERFREKVAPLAEVFAFSRLSAAPAIVDGQAELVTGQWVSGGYFESLGIAASIGRAIAKSDDRASASPVALLSHSYWSRRFAADRAVLGKVINVGGNSFTIAGVAPPGFGGTLQVDDAPDLYLPMGFEPAVQSTESNRHLFALPAADQRSAHQPDDISDPDSW
jgi:hypothetical protein